LAEEQIPSPLGPPPQLTPLPIPERAPKSRKLLWVMLVLVLVLICSCAGAAAIGLNWAFSPEGLEWQSNTLLGMAPGEQDFSAPYDYAEEGGARAAVWTANERFALAQSYDFDGAPVVVAVDMQSGDVLTEPGYILKAVEPTGSVVWLIAADDVSEDSRGWVGLADGLLDSPAVYSLRRWDLGGAYPEPADDRSPEWTPVVNAQGVEARFTLDTALGAYPSELRFAWPGGSEVVADIDPEVVTYRPIGWSPSGKFFAIEQLVQSKDYVSADEWSFEFYDGPPRLLIMFDAVTGKPVFEQQVMNDALDPAFWHPERDLVLWANQQVLEEPDAGIEGKSAMIMAADPSGSVGPASERLGFEEPVAWGDLPQLTLVGVRPSGLLVTAPWAGTPMWLVASDQTVKGAGAADILSGGAWSEKSGVLSMGQYTDLDTSAELDALRAYDVNGGPRRDLWLATPPASTQGGTND